VSIGNLGEICEFSEGLHSLAMVRDGVYSALQKRQLTPIMMLREEGVGLSSLQMFMHLILPLALHDSTRKWAEIRLLGKTHPLKKLFNSSSIPSPVILSKADSLVVCPHMSA